MIDIRLKVFLSAAMNLSFTKASQELFISQPASVSISRSWSGSITAGSSTDWVTAYSSPMPVSYSLTRKKNTAGLSADGLRHELPTREGSRRTARWGQHHDSQYVLPGIIADFHKRFPDIRITMLSGNSREVETALARGAST